MPRIPALTLGWRLKMALNEIPAHEMAEHLEVSRQTLSRWMADRGAPPKRAYILQWALRTGVDPVWLETGTADGGDGGANERARHDSNVRPRDYKADASVLTFPVGRKSHAA